ncbi:uncharacterized protein LOC113494557 isoform X2 [Trichoplusia ni]|uniref:Uncharacterized protein LOC113494557 isoform X2 n=1 Tax=Trichoplusia ni TaxID=7111 RepID=A0A7E5VKN8_TRINI|nr:uncharacterized protein LOC113494557 isoform X2 [Trichoplusia ni]
MATIKHLLVFFAILVSSALTLAQDSSSEPPIPGSSDVPDVSTSAPYDGSSTPHMASSAAGLYGHFPLSNFNWNQILGASVFGGLLPLHLL